MHVGLNLIFLVPGETGGMEVAARELIPALLARRRRGCASPRSSTARPRPRRRAVGRAAARGDRAGERAQPRRSGCSASRRCCRALAARARASTSCTASPRTAPAVGALPPRRDRPRPDLRALPGGPRGPPRPGHARARAGRRAPLGPRDRRLAAARATTSSSCSASRPERIDVVPLGPRRGAARASRSPSASCASASASASAACCSASRPSARTRTCSR